MALVGCEISTKAFRNTILQSYDSHLKRNTSNVIAVITKETNNTVAAIWSFLQLLTSLVLVISIEKKMQF